MKKGFLLIYFFFFYLKEVVAGALRISWDVLTPGLPLHPQWIRVALDIEKGWQQLMLANLVSMTPGTLSIDVDREKRVLVVHCLYGEGDGEGEVRQIKERFESLIRRVFD